jgi:hypothetical protein
MKILSTHYFNTSNGYTDHGQRIGCVYLEDASIVFADIDRGIEGMIPGTFDPTASIEARVIRAYVHGGLDYWKHRIEDYEQWARMRIVAANEARKAPSLTTGEPHAMR